MPVVPRPPGLATRDNPVVLPVCIRRGPMTWWGNAMVPIFYGTNCTHGCYEFPESYFLDCANPSEVFGDSVTSDQITELSRVINGYTSMYDGNVQFSREEERQWRRLNRDYCCGAGIRDSFCVFEDSSLSVFIYFLACFFFCLGLPLAILYLFAVGVDNFANIRTRNDVTPLVLFSVGVFCLVFAFCCLPMCCCIGVRSVRKKSIRNLYLALINARLSEGGRGLEFGFVKKDLTYTWRPTPFITMYCSEATLANALKEAQADQTSEPAAPTVAAALPPPSMSASSMSSASLSSSVSSSAPDSQSSYDSEGELPPPPCGGLSRSVSSSAPDSQSSYESEGELPPPPSGGLSSSVSSSAPDSQSSYESEGELPPPSYGGFKV